MSKQTMPPETQVIIDGLLALLDQYRTNHACQSPDCPECELILLAEAIVPDPTPEPPQ